MGKASRDKGNRFERAIVNLLRAYGLEAFRVPISGSARGFKGDVELRLLASTMNIEAKSRRGGFTAIYRALGENDVLAIKQDSCEPLGIMRLNDLAAILRRLEAIETGSPRQASIESPLTKADVITSISSDTKTLPYKAVARG